MLTVALIAVARAQREQIASILARLEKLDG